MRRPYKSRRRCTECNRMFYTTEQTWYRLTTNNVWDRIIGDCVLNVRLCSKECVVKYLSKVKEQQI